MRRTGALAIALCGTIGGSLPALSSESGPRVFALVVDAASLAPLPGSIVVFRPVRKDEAPGRAGVWVPSGEPSISVETDAEGVACAGGLPAGNFLPEISKPGFWNTRSEPFQIPPEPCKTPEDMVERLEVRVGLAARQALDVERSREGGGSASTASAPLGPTRRLRVQILDEGYKSELPGVIVMLLPVSGSGPDTDGAWLDCRWSTADDCRAIVDVTRNRGGACFDDLPAGRYRVRTQLDGFWDTEVGPIDVPPTDFGQPKVPIALELSWTERAALKQVVTTSEDSLPELPASAPPPPPDDCP